MLCEPPVTERHPSAAVHGGRDETIGRVDRAPEKACRLPKKARMAGARQTKSHRLGEEGRRNGRAHAGGGNRARTFP